MSQPAVDSIYRYPVKGLSPERLASCDIEPGGMIAHDRAYAIENGSRDFDPINPKYLPKAKFLQLMSHEQLAALETRFDAATSTLKILRDGKQVSAGNLSLPIGRQLIEQFLAAYFGSAARGTPHIVTAADHHFADVPDSFVSLVNLASLRDIERVMHRQLDPLRFRANIYIDIGEPWIERTWIGGKLRIGEGVVLSAIENITRCAAVNVDPATGHRDAQIPRTLNDIFGHEDCGVYLSALTPGTINEGDTVELVSAPSETSAGDNLGIR